ncbi:MAG: cupin domain-containing protein [Actinomycetota bacterium]|nr:cupin domain-containing protein [Actinomycetota bacterium]
MSQQSTTATVRAVRVDEGDISRLGGVQDRFIIDGHESGQRFALVEHRFDPRALAAPMHRHRNEDEYSIIVEGRMGAVLGGTEVFGTAGDVIFKPRDQWHTFWNAGDEPLVVLELISPAGLERLFRAFAEEPDPDPGRLAEMAAEYGCELSFETTMPVVEKHGLRM